MFLLGQIVSELTKKKFASEMTASHTRLVAVYIFCWLWAVCVSLSNVCASKVSLQQFLFQTLVYRSPVLLLLSLSSMQNGIVIDLNQNSKLGLIYSSNDVPLTWFQSKKYQVLRLIFDIISNILFIQGA